MNREDITAPYGAFLGADWKEVEPGIFVHIAELSRQPAVLRVVSDEVGASGEVGSAA